MALQPSGQISTENINVELGRSGSTLWASDQRQVRQLADSVTNSLMTPNTNDLAFTSFYNKSRVRQHTFTRTNTVNRKIAGGDLNARIWGNNTTYMTYSPGDDLGGFPEYSPANPPFYDDPPPDPYTFPYYLDSYSCDFVLNANLFNVDPTNWTVNSLSFSFSGIHTQTQGFEFYGGFFSRENLGVTWFENFVDLPEKYYSTGLSGPFYPSTVGGNYTCTVPFTFLPGNWVNSQTSANIGNLATGIKNSGTNFSLSLLCRIFAFPGSYPSVTINNNINVTITTTIN